MARAKEILVTPPSAQALDKLLPTRSDRLRRITAFASSYLITAVNPFTKHQPRRRCILSNVFINEPYKQRRSTAGYHKRRNRVDRSPQSVWATDSRSEDAIRFDRSVLETETRPVGGSQFITEQRLFRLDLFFNLLNEVR